MLVYPSSYRLRMPLFSVNHFDSCFNHFYPHPFAVHLLYGGINILIVVRHYVRSHTFFTDFLNMKVAFALSHSSRQLFLQALKRQ